jgi:hypothetical protein
MMPMIQARPVARTPPVPLLLAEKTTQKLAQALDAASEPKTSDLTEEEQEIMNSDLQLHRRALLRPSMPRFRVLIPNLCLLQ